MIRTVRNLLKKPIFVQGNANWILELQSVIKKYNISIHSSIKMTTNPGSKKTNEKLVYTNLQDLDNNQSLNYGKKFVQLILKEFLVKAIQQIGHINYLQ